MRIMATHCGHTDLQGLICSSNGIALRMDNCMCWTSTINGIQGQCQKDCTCTFKVCLVSGGKVQITDYKGDYLFVDPCSCNKIKTSKTRKSPYSEFEVLFQNGKVMFKACNGLFLSRIYYVCPEIHTVEAQKQCCDVHCLFEPVA